jgi:hypothetical protein
LPSRPDPADLVAEQRQRDGEVESVSNARGVVAAGDSESRASLQTLEKEFSTETLRAGTQPLDTLGKSHQGNRQSPYRLLPRSCYIRPFSAGDGMAAVTLSSSSNSATA